MTTDELKELATLAIGPDKLALVTSNGRDVMAHIDHRILDTVSPAIAQTVVEDVLNLLAEQRIIPAAEPHTARFILRTGGAITLQAVSES